MSRIAIVDKHDETTVVSYFLDSATDVGILSQLVNHCTAHAIKRVTICQSGIVIENTTTLEIAIATTERLTA